MFPCNAREKEFKSLLRYVSILQKLQTGRHTYIVSYTHFRSEMNKNDQIGRGHCGCFTIIFKLW